MWPSIPLVVDKRYVGTAFGLCTAIQNLGLAAFPFLNGQLRDRTGGYTASQLVFAGLGLVGLVFAIIMAFSAGILGGDHDLGHHAEAGGTGTEGGAEAAGSGAITPDATHPLASPNLCGRARQYIHTSCRTIRSRKISQMIP